MPERQLNALRRIAKFGPADGMTTHYMFRVLRQKGLVSKKSFEVTQAGREALHRNILPHDYICSKF